MAVDVLNITLDDVKMAAVDMYNQVNGVQENISLEHTTVSKAPQEETLYMNTGARGVGVLMDKILLQDILPTRFDLRPFKDQVSMQGKELDSDDVDTINNKYNAEIVTAERDILKSPTNLSKETLINWVLFCRVLGFFELDIGDVTLTEVEGMMYVSVNPTHAIYYGFVEVLV